MHPKVGKFKPGDSIVYKHNKKYKSRLAFPEVKLVVVGIKLRKDGNHLYRIQVTKKVYKNLAGDFDLRTKTESRGVKTTDTLYELSLKGSLRNL